MARDKLTLPEAALENAEIQQLMGNQPFRRFMKRLADRSAIFEATHGPDARHSAFREGRRALGLELLELIDRAVPGARMAILSESVTVPQGAKRERRDYDTFRDIADGGDAD
jgi:hypothetical protein